MTDEEIRGLESIKPTVVERACGGWLAHSPKGERLRIGVTAETEMGARDRFFESLALWIRDITSDQRPQANTTASPTQDSMK